MITSISNERQPLLQRSPPLDGPALLENTVQAKASSKRHLGPSEMNRGARAGILAGAWMAVFVEVGLEYIGGIFGIEIPWYFIFCKQ